MSRRRRRQYDLDLVSDINVTSLVDVTMTLLIIFIIVAPMIEQGIDITLPTAEPKRIDMASVMTPPENEWIHITCVYDNAANTKAIYVNGTQDRIVTTNAGATVVKAITRIRAA